MKHSQPHQKTRLVSVGSTVLMGAYTLMMLLCFGAMVFGLGFAVEYVAVGVVEEFMFTGVLFGVLRQHANDFASVAQAAALTALVFALCHLSHVWKVPIAFMFSIGMIWLYQRTNSIWWPICAHVMFDMIWFGVIGLV